MAGENRRIKFCKAIIANRAWGCTRKLLCFVRSSPRVHWSTSLCETSPTDATISRKTFRRLTEEKATLAREIEERKYCLNFAGLEENVSVPLSWEGKTEEHSMCVGDCIDSDRVL